MTTLRGAEAPWAGRYITGFSLNYPCRWHHSIRVLIATLFPSLAYFSLKNTPLSVLVFR